MRGDGSTTRQMQEAPHGAVFAWVSNVIRYPIRLAEFLGRTDLKIVGQSWVSARKWLGTRDPVVVDHAFFWLSVGASQEARSAVREMREYLDGAGVRS